MSIHFGGGNRQHGVLLGILAAMALLATAFAYQRIRTGPHAGNGRPEPSNGADRDWTLCPPGPWGNLQHVRIATERPDEFITLNRTFAGQDRWVFQGYSTNQLDDLFATNDLTQAQRALLMDRGRWEVQAGAIALTPDRETILGLGPQARERIYNVLAEFPENYYQHLGFRYREDGFNEWFSRSGLSLETLALVRKLIYRRGTAICFSDLNEVLAGISSPAEQRRLIKTLSRVSTLLVRLNVGPDMDVGPLVSYWGKVGQAKAIKPLLESLASLPRGGSLDIAHLLPPFARMRLYTYPLPSEDPLAIHRDCLWTAMNFFAETPDDRFCEFAHAQEVIRSQYYPIQDDPTFGDLLWITNDRGRMVHVAVYIAADIVFTKNGAHFAQPWVLMHMRDMLAFFTSGKPLQIVAYRLKSK